MAFIRGMSLAGVSFLAMSSPAIAQDAQTAVGDSTEANEDIVVTGTLIRGIAPVGNNVIAVGEQKIRASGASNTSELLAKLPQLGNFGAAPFGTSPQIGANSSNPINRPNLRNLPGANTSGSAQTLVLVDGHRVVGAGTQQVAVDPDIIAPGAIQRVEALTDGGSAVYGSDAMGGVINFITRKRFDGVELSSRVGFGDAFTTWDGSVLAGKDWGSGGVYISYNYSHHDEFYGRDRDYIRRVNIVNGAFTGTPTGLNCASPNVTSGGTSYAVSGNALVAGGPNTCDLSDDMTFFPRTTAHNVYARINQELADWLTFDATVLWARRESLSDGGRLGQSTFQSATVASVVLNAGNPFLLPGAAAPQTVNFTYGPSSPQKTNLSTFAITPEFTAKLGGDWQLRALFSYGRSNVNYDNLLVSSTAQAAFLGNATPSVGVNPYNPTGAGSNQGNLARILGHNTGFGKNELFDYRLIADGTLFDLPAGPLKVAVGFEHMHDNFQNAFSVPTNFVLNPTGEGFTQQPTQRYTQKVTSLFGEAQIPIFGEENGFGGMELLTLSASGRYDKYNDVGDTFNPKIGLAWKPIKWFTIRGNWGKSFTAPSPSDQAGQGTFESLSIFSFNPAPQTVAGAVDANGTVVTGQTAFVTAPGAGQETAIVLRNGAALGLVPQKSTNWSIGGTIEPPFVPGLRLDISYYHIALRDPLSRPVGANNTTFYPAFPNLWYFRPTRQNAVDYLAASGILPGNTLLTICPGAANSQAVVSTTGNCTLGTPGTNLVGGLIDSRARNTGTATIGGLDFSVSYQRETGFGSIDASFSGNYRLEFETQSQVGSAVIDGLANSEPELRTQVTLGADVRTFRIQGTWNHVDGFERAGGASAANNLQGHVGPLNTFDLFMKYEFGSKGILNDTTVSLNIQNVFNASPPIYVANTFSNPGFDPNYLNLGRIFQLGLRKKF